MRKIYCSSSNKPIPRVMLNQLGPRLMRAAISFGHWLDYRLHRVGIDNRPQSWSFVQLLMGA